MKTVGLDVGTLKAFAAKRGPGFNLIFLSMADFPRALSQGLRGNFSGILATYENFQSIPHLLRGLLTTNLPICRICKVAHSFLQANLMDSPISCEKNLQVLNLEIDQKQHTVDEIHTTEN